MEFHVSQCRSECAKNTSSHLLLLLLQSILQVFVLSSSISCLAFSSVFPCSRHTNAFFSDSFNPTSFGQRYRLLPSNVALHKCFLRKTRKEIDKSAVAQKHSECFGFCCHTASWWRRTMEEREREWWTLHCRSSWRDGKCPHGCKRVSHSAFVCVTGAHRPVSAAWHP